MKLVISLISITVALKSVHSFLPSAFFLQQHNRKYEHFDGNIQGSNDLKQVSIIVEGQVQGPYYRTICKNEVVFNRKLNGYLKEKEHNITELVIEGPQSKLESFIRWCRKGPGLSQYVNVKEVIWQNNTEGMKGFNLFMLPNTIQEIVVTMRGQVQGPFFRTTCSHEVLFNRKLSGSLREFKTGETEIIVQGPPSKLESFIRWCKKGPGFDQVVQLVDVRWQEVLKPTEGFVVIALDS